MNCDIGLVRPITEVRDLWIPVSGGRRLAARMWLPDDAEDRPVAAIIEAIPYRRLDGTVELDVRTHPWWAARGFACIRLDLAGSGDSDGILLDEYLESEQDDVCEVLAWIAAQSWCSGATGMIGISWGGFAALQVAARQPPSLRAIVTCCSTDDRYNDDVHFMGGCLLTDNISWGGGLFSCVSRWPDPLVVGDSWRTTWLERLNETDCSLIDWMHHQSRDAFWEHGSVCQNYDAIDVPVYCVGGWTDGYSNALLRMMEHLNVPRRALIGPWTHVYPHFGNPGDPIGFLQDGLRWWKRWLDDAENGIESEPGLSLWMQEDLRADPMTPAVSGGWISEHAWPAACEPAVLYLGARSLEAEPCAGPVFQHRSLLSCGMAGGEWCPRDGGGTGAEFQSDQRIDDMHALCFDSVPLDDQMTILGAPEVVLRLSVDRPQALVAVRLNEVTPDGRSTRVTFGLLNLSHRFGNATPTHMTPDRVETVTVRLNDTAYRFSPGNRIRLAISTSYWPMVWPSPEPATLTLVCEGSVVVMPNYPGPPSDAVPPVFAEPDLAPPHPVDVLETGFSDLDLVRDMSDNTVVLHRRESSGRRRLADLDLVVCKETEEVFSIGEDDPVTASMTTARVVRGERGDWRPRTETGIAFSCDRDNFRITASLDAFEGERQVCKRRWDEKIPRDHM